MVGTGFIGGILGRAPSRSGHSVTFGSRHPDIPYAPVFNTLGGENMEHLDFPDRRLALRLLEG